MKGYIILDVIGISVVFVALYCLFNGAIILSGLFIWISLMVGGISMHMEVKTINENRIESIKSLRDWE